MSTQARSTKGVWKSVGSNRYVLVTLVLALLGSFIKRRQTTQIISGEGRKSSSGKRSEVRCSYWLIA